VHILKIRRCSDNTSRAADALSKSNFQSARSICQLDTEPASIPVSLLKWVDQPVLLDNLADDILCEIAKCAPVLNYSI
jgi:hypothetical protein